MGHWIVCSDGSLNFLQLWVTDTQLRIHTSISFYFGSVVFGARDTKWYHVNLSSQLQRRPGICAVRDLISINCIRMKEKTGRAPVDNLWMQVIDDWLIYAVPLKQYIIYDVSCRCRFSLWSIIMHLWDYFMPGLRLDPRGAVQTFRNFQNYNAHILLGFVNFRVSSLQFHSW